MAALGNFLKKIDAKNGFYERDKVKYEKLSQDPHDNEAEDDDVVFSQDGVVANGHTDTTQLNGHNGVQLEKAKILKNSDVEVKVKKLRILSRYRALCICCILLLVIAGALFIGLLWPVIKPTTFSSKPTPRPKYSSTPDWTRTFPNSMSESCVRLYDVDGDGRDDVIVGIDRVERIVSALQIKRKDMDKYCESQGESTPCMGTLMALRGHNGELIWSIPVYGTVFEINCGKIDVNKDGHMDCLGAGRLGTSMAFDPRNGNVHWREYLNATHEAWNTYNMLVLPDVTGDDVNDVILPDGGDPNFPPEAHVRMAGRLILLDGATGKSLGRPLEIVDAWGEKETYMSPVLHRTLDGSVYILYGSGGETVPGSLYMISLADYYRHVMRLDRGSTVPSSIPGQYNDFPHFHRSPEGIVAIYNSSLVGVMVPPVLIDIDKDGVKDILMLAHDGTLELYNGQTLTSIWKQAYPGFEAYSTPAPGYLNDDDVPDFMFHMNRGTWADGYTYALSIALDGKTGQQILAINTSRYEMSSDLVAMTTEQHRDVFVVRMQRIVNNTQEQREKRQLYGSRRYSHLSPGSNSQYNYGTESRPYRYKSKQDEERNPFDYRSNPLSNPNMQRYGSRGSYSRDNSRYYDNSNYEDPGSYSREGGSRYQGNTDSRLQMPDTVFDPSKYLMGSEDDESYDYDNQMPAYIDPDQEEQKVFHPDPQRPQIDTQRPLIDGNEECRPGSKKLSTVTEIYVIDRTNLNKPLRIAADQPTTIYYNLTEAEKKQGALGAGGETIGAPQIDVNTVLQEGDPLCSVMKTTERTTGAIGDLDGDGELDLVLVLEQSGSKHDRYGSDIDTVANTKIVRINLKKAIENGVHADLNIKLAPGIKSAEGEKPLNELEFKEVAKQRWTAYMGTNGDSVYEEL